MVEEALGLLERELSEYEYHLRNHTLAAKRKLLQYKIFDPERCLEASCALKESHILLNSLLSRVKKVKKDFRRLPENVLMAAFTSGAPLDTIIKTEIETEMTLAKLEAKFFLFREASRQKNNGPSSPLEGLTKTELEEQLAENQEEDCSVSLSAFESRESGKKSFAKRVFG